MIRLVPRAPQACVAFHLRDGMAGHVDMGSGYFETTREPTARCGHLQMREAGGANGTGLIEYGSTARDMSSYPWFVQRWRGQIMQATFGKGWRLLVPMVQRPGFRVVAFAKDLEIQSFERGTGFHFSCARGLEGGLERILLAGVCNNVQILEVDFRRTWNREKDVACV